MRHETHYTSPGVETAVGKVDQQDLLTGVSSPRPGPGAAALRCSAFNHLLQIEEDQEGLQQAVSKLALLSRSASST